MMGSRLLLVAAPLAGSAAVWLAAPDGSSVTCGSSCGAHSLHTPLAVCDAVRAEESVDASHRGSGAPQGSIDACSGLLAQPHPTGAA